MKFAVLTIFPEIFSGFLKESIIGRAIEDGKIEVSIIDIRDFAKDKHKNVDDRPYGGGAGMVMKVEPLFESVEFAKTKYPGAKVAVMSPGGKKYTQKIAEELSFLDELIIVCGRYEGIDQRFIELCCDMEISSGDYVLTGGEIPAMAIIDSVGRLIPGVLGCGESVQEESFQSGRLEYPHYTRPFKFRGREVPKVLLSGNHGEIKKWRKTVSFVKTLNKRPDLLFSNPVSEEEKKILSGTIRRLEDFVGK
ncbi:MAG: tRNA (guanosine(37)-N1)-methyltransferase TrmD [Desulforegulaceae bacterium]|nr:tRNA (guanosine(37)-N1)-methyltransferase TrmD [Desulforegulaceae bacterium]